MRIGIDLGGTKIEAIALTDHGVEHARVRVPTPRGDYTATIESIAALVSQLESGVEAVESVGIGIPGTVSEASGLVKNANSTWLNGRPFGLDVSRRLGREVRVANDANCLALSEAVDGAGRGAPVVFAVVLGTGTGGGLAVHGRVVTGVNGIAGEWGHNPMPWPRPEEWPGPACYCGRTGCIETFLAGPSLARAFAEVTAVGLTPDGIAKKAEQGDATARRVLDQYYDRVARALASVINVLDPHVIVLGGGVSNLRALYDEVPRRWLPFVFSDAVLTRLVPAMHGDSSGVRGAAWLWSDMT